MKLLFAASECVPFIKTGGLADVVGSLPIELARQGEDARVILPKYRLIDGYWKSRMTHVSSFEVLFGQEYKFCGVETLKDSGVTYYFIDNEEFFSCDPIYGDGLNEGMRYAFFCRAILEALPRIGFVPDVLHLNDWQTGLAAAMLKTQYGSDMRMQGVRTVFSIHNLKYQGIFNWADLNARTGFDASLFSPDYLEFYGDLSCMKAGLVFADHVCTVSPSYAEEIKTAYYGEQLDGLLRLRGNTVSGILNGIDTTIYAPATDRFLPVHFTSDDLTGKAEMKALLQEECHLAVRPEVPLIGMIARLTPQKGLDLIERVLSDILRMDVQMVFLGGGDRRYMDLLNWASWRYAGQVGSSVGLNEGLAHRIYAGSDLFLMPSQFEPCGLSQMIALRYGTIPIVRETGGLRDSIQPYNQYTDEGTGFSFANYNAHEMLYTIERAVHYYYDDKPMWLRLMRRGMAADFGWPVSAGKYLALYRSLLSGQPTCVSSPYAQAENVPAAAVPAQGSAVAETAACVECAPAGVIPATAEPAAAGSAADAQQASLKQAAAKTAPPGVEAPQTADAADSEKKRSAPAIPKKA